MKKLITILSIAAVILSCVGIIASAVGEGETLEIVKDGEPVYSIVYSEFWTHTNSMNLEEVERFRDLIKAQTGVELPVYTAESKITDKEIFVGNSTHVIGINKQRAEECVLPNIAETVIGERGFMITTDGDRIFISADNELGAESAINFFMQEILGCDILNEPDEKKSTLSVPADLRIIKSDYLECDTNVVMDIDGTDVGEFTIVYPSGRDENADEDGDYFELLKAMRRYIFAETGRKLEFMSDRKEPTGHEIVIGRTNRKDLSDLDEKEMFITVEDGNLYICGGNDFTTASACALFDSRCLCVSDGEYTGGSLIRLDGGMTIREQLSFAKSASVDVDQIDYVRDNIKTLLGTDETPCFSDPETADRLYEAITAEPHRSGEEVFINCNRADWCQCEKCGGKTNAFLETVNKVADRLEEQQITVSIIATNELRAPTVEKMSDNVWVYFAEPRVCCAHALNDDSCGDNRKIAEDLEAWTKAAGNVCVLDYTMNYQHYPSTFPDLGVLHPNFNYYHELGVDGVLMVWQKGSSILEFGDIRLGIINALIADPGMNDDDYAKLENSVIEGLYGDRADVIKKYISRFTEESAEHFTIFTRPDELLPIKRIKGKTGAEAYDLSLAKELANLWESIYERHDPPDPPLKGVEMSNLEQSYYNSDYYLPLHSRVQLTEWLNANIPQKDRNAVFTEIVNSYPAK